MTLAQNYWLLFKLKLARWHDRRAHDLIADVEADLRKRGYRL